MNFMRLRGQKMSVVCRARGASGFTLIELMIVVIVISILAAVALPSYQESVRKSRRADAKSALIQLAQFMERNFSLSQRYDLDSAGKAVALPFSESPVDSSTKFYDLSLSAVDQSTFTLTATPKNGQVTDVCKNLTIDNAGSKGTSSGRADCW